MDLLEYSAKIAILTANIVVGTLFVMLFSLKFLFKYTDIGIQKKKERDKTDRILNSKPTQSSKEDTGFTYKKPRIETSFGDRRIGEDDDNPTQT